MNDYITLNGKQYKTMRGWEPELVKPSTDRMTLAGDFDVTYGPGSTWEWNGEIKVPNTGDATWGGLTDFQTLMALRTNMTFIDHAGTSHTVHALGRFSRRTLHTLWDATSNEYYFTVRLVKAA